MRKCPCIGETLDRLLRPAILVVLAREELHGYLIIQRITEMAIQRGQKPDATGVYRLLNMMQEDGFITASLEPSDTRPDRRLYAITPAGIECLTHWVQTLENYRHALDGLLADARDAIAGASSAGDPVFKGG